MDKLQVLEFYLGSYHEEKSNNFEFICPICHHPKPHLVYKLDKDIYHCWVCDFKGRGLYSLLRRSGFNIDKSIIENVSKKYDSIDNIKEMLNGNNKESERILSIPNEYKPIYSLKEDTLYNIGYKYIVSRGLDNNDILKYNIHYSIKDRRILFPSYDENLKLNYYVARTLDKDIEHKYINAKVSKKKIIFNEHLINWKEELLIVEGIFDCIHSRRNCVPILGSIITQDSLLFKKIQKHNTYILIAFDPDAWKKQILSSYVLYENGISVKFLDTKNLDKSKDFGDMNIEEVNKVLEDNTKQFDFKQLIKNKILMDS